MNRYEQYIYETRKTKARSFEIGDKIVWRYHSGDDPWYGIITCIGTDGTVYANGAWNARQAFETRVRAGSGRFEPTRADGYLELYQEGIT